MKLNEHPTVMQYREKVEEDSLTVVQEKLDSALAQDRCSGSRG